MLRDCERAGGADTRILDTQPGARRVSLDSVLNRDRQKSAHSTPGLAVAIWHMLWPVVLLMAVQALSAARRLLKNVWKCMLSLDPNTKSAARANSLGSEWKCEKAEGLVLRACLTDAISLGTIGIETPGCLNK